MGSIKILKLQSADVYDSEASADTREVLTFAGVDGDVEDVGYLANPIASASATQNTSLANFLSRPTLIDTRTWSTADVAGLLGGVIEPWHLFLNNSIIKNKLANYAFIRAKLCMKFIINATPFHYGCLRVAYEPNVNATDTGDRKSKIRTNAVSNIPLITPFSQLPGIWIYPEDDAGGELHVPFFKNTNWLRLKTAAPAKTMGVLDYFIAFPLSVASASGSSTVTLETFAWLEDVELSGATNELTLQAKDEYDGPISKTASAVAAAASKLGDVPVIGKFARATTIGAGAVAKIASMFGFTNTPIIDGIPARIPMPGPQIASAEISAPIQKLALDPKQELSIDPTLHGIPNTDEMVIQELVKKPNCLTVHNWATTDAVGNVLFNANVSPSMFHFVPVNDSGGTLRARRVYHTTMSYVNMLFTHWRGDIIFEVDVICTKFHKGRLKISWDPLGSGGATALPENTVYTTILDIGVNNKAIFRVPYHQAYSWLRTRGVSRQNWGTGGALPVNDFYDNGLLIVSVLTPLMSPVSPQTVGIKVSVYAAENLEFANARSTLANQTFATPPSFFAVQGKDEVDTVASDVTFGDKGDMHPERFALNFGESIVSLRSLLHRMSLYDTSCPGDSTATAYFRYQKSYSRLPPMFGYDPNGLSLANKSLTVGTAAFNFVPTHPITYISMMYGAFRGGVNYTANVGSDLYPSISDIRVHRINDNSEYDDRRGRVALNQNGSANISTLCRFLNNTSETGTAGAAFTNSSTNGAISWNMPHMSCINWNYPDPTYSMRGNTWDETDYECSLLEILFKQSTANTVSRAATIATFAGTGVDFTCLWYLCCPTLDYYIDIPTSA